MRRKRKTWKRLRSRRSRPSLPTPTAPTPHQRPPQRTMTTTHWRPRCARLCKGGSAREVGAGSWGLVIAMSNRQSLTQNSELRTALAQILANDELEARPDLVHRADLDINIAHRQRDIANDVFGDVGRHPGRFFRPRYPDHPVWLELVAVARQLLLQLIAAHREDVDDVGGLCKLCIESNAVWQRLKQRRVLSWCINQQQPAALLDAEFL